METVCVSRKTIAVLYNTIMIFVRLHNSLLKIIHTMADLLSKTVENPILCKLYAEDRKLISAN